MENIFAKIGYSLSSTRNNATDIVLDMLFIKNPDGSPRWIWNANCNTPLFLKFYNIGSFRAWLFATAIKTVFIFRLQKIVFSKKTAYGTENENPILDYKKNWALFTGTIGPNNKAILYANNSFFKIATTPNAQELINREYSILEMINRNQNLFITPKSTQISNEVIQLSDVSENGTRTKSITTSHLTTLLEMRNIEPQTTKISEWNSFNSLKMDLYSLEDSRIPSNMIRKIKTLIENCSENEKVELSLSQGDFTQWNMYERNGKIALYDWELASFDKPKGFDYFHFIIQQGVLVDHKSWTNIYKDIIEVFVGDFGKQLFNNDLDKLNDYLKWYLIINCIHYLKIYSEQLKWHVQIDWLLQVWNEGLNLFMVEEKTLRELVIMDVFDLLQNQEYAALKFNNGFPEKLSLNSDIDLIINKKANQLIVSFLENHALVSKITSNKKSFMNSVQVFLNDGTLLSLDLIWQLKVKSLEILDTKQIIASNYINKYGVKNASSVDTARFITLFYSLNNSEIPAKYLDYKQAIQNSNESLDLILKNYFGKTNKDKENVLNFIKRNPKNQSFSGIKNTLNYYTDTMRNSLNNRGFIVTFSGVDGAGKSTVIENIALRIEKQLRKPVVVLRHRPSILPILSVWSKGKEKAHQDVIKGLPRQGKNKSSLSSFIRFLYYYFDYLFGQFVVYFKYILRGKVVIYDRYYFDFINDSKRSNIVLPQKLTSFFYKFLLKPEFNFFLFADANTILKRKKELSKATIEKLTADYHGLFESLQSKSKASVYQSINNIELEVTLNQVVKTIILSK
jgi:thymidylate kinase